MVDENKVAHLMRTLSLTREAALDLIADDEETDRMTMKQINAELTPEQKAAQKKMRATGERKVAKDEGEKKKRARKVDEEKVAIINKMLELASVLGENPKIISAEHEVSFDLNGFSWSMTLTKHRNK